MKAYITTIKFINSGFELAFGSIKTALDWLKEKHPN